MSSTPSLGVTDLVTVPNINLGQQLQGYSVQPGNHKDTLAYAPALVMPLQPGKNTQTKQKRKQ
jgi:hypothetical protein